MKRVLDAAKARRSLREGAHGETQIAQPAPPRRVRREARAGKAPLAVADLLIALFLLIAGLKFTFALENFWSLRLYDESAYLYAGVKLPALGLPSAEYAPLYALWYYALSLLQPDRIALYFLNYKVVTILPPILAFFLLRRYRVSLIVSVVISGVFLISNANLPVWPKPAHFALVI